MSRLLKHLLHTPFTTRRAFPASLQETLRQLVAEGEQTHRGEIRFVVEGDWPLLDVLGKKTTRERALEVFGQARVWDTHENTGLLVYVLLCEHKVEILADRGLHAAAGSGTWESLCAELSAAYQGGRFEEGSVTLLRQLNTLLRGHFPAENGNPNELPDMPIVLR